MNQVTQNIFRVVHEGKWLSIEYKNKMEEVTRYWIAVQGIDAVHRTLRVEGFHLKEHTIGLFQCRCV